MNLKKSAKLYIHVQFYQNICYCRGYHSYLLKKKSIFLLQQVTVITGPFNVSLATVIQVVTVIIYKDILKPQIVEKQIDC